MPLHQIDLVVFKLVDLTGNMWLVRTDEQLKMRTFLCFRGMAGDRFLRQLTIHDEILLAVGNAQKMAEYVNRHAFHNDSAGWAFGPVTDDDNWESAVYHGCRASFICDGLSPNPWRFRVTAQNHPYSYAEGRAWSKDEAMDRASRIAQELVR